MGWVYKNEVNIGKHLAHGTKYTEQYTKQIYYIISLLMKYLI